MSYTIEFYITKNGEVLIWEFLEKLRKKSKNDKNARIQYRQISLYIELLQRNGVNLNENIIKHLEDGIWELRPGVNRIFFGSSNIEMGKKWYENIIFSFIYAIISMKVIY